MRLHLFALAKVYGYDGTLAVTRDHLQNIAGVTAHLIEGARSHCRSEITSLLSGSVVNSGHICKPPYGNWQDTSDRIARAPRSINDADRSPVACSTVLGTEACGPPSR